MHITSMRLFLLGDLLGLVNYNMEMYFTYAFFTNVSFLLNVTVQKKKKSF